MRRIKRAKVRFLSLCKRGANQLQTVYKDDGSLELRAQILKAEDFAEKGELVAVVYAPDFVDAQGDFADAEVIKQMAYDAMKEGVEIDIRHNEQPVGRDKAYVAESFIIQKDDPRFADQVTYNGEAVDVAGGWGVVLKIEDEALRKSYGEEGWQGISLGGSAIVEDVPQSTNKASAIAAFKARKESHMTPEEIQKAVAGALGDMLKPLADKVEKMEAEVEARKAAEAKAAQEAEAEAKKAAEIDPTDAEAVRKHLAKLEREALQKSIDWNDAEAVRKHYEAIQADDKKASRQPEGTARVQKTDEEQAIEDLLKAVDDLGKEG